MLSTVRISKTVVLALMVSGALACTGCGGSGPSVYPVTGTLKWSDGSPVAGANLLFDQQAAKPMSAYGSSGADGTYSVQLDEENVGAPAGEYKVSVTGDGINEKYHDASTTPLTATVTKEGPNKFDFTIEK